MKNGKSLLPAGIIKVEGHFQRGDIIKIANKNGKIVGNGISAYDSSEITQIIGLQTDKINSQLGWDGPNEVIHHDDMVIIPPLTAAANVK